MTACTVLPHSKSIQVIDLIAILEDPIMDSKNTTISHHEKTSSYDHNFLTLTTAAKIKAIRRELQLSQATFALYCKLV